MKNTEYDRRAMNSSAKIRQMLYAPRQPEVSKCEMSNIGNG